MNKFIGRANELKHLNDSYNKDQFQMTVIYGRRRVGKTFLINEFIKDKKSVYFMATNTSYQDNFRAFSKTVLSQLSNDMSGMSFDTTEDLFSFFTRVCQNEKIVIVIDELPYIAEENKNFLSLMQKFIDQQWINTKMFLILCGSSISFMEDEVLSQKSPIFGRRTSQINLKPFSYKEAAEFTPNYSSEEKAICYGITGGIARYLSLIDESLTLDENIVSLFFSKMGYLYEEPNNLLSQEFRNVPTYANVISAIAAGSNKLSELTDKCNIDSDHLSHILNALIRVEIVEKNVAITDEKNKKKSMYSLKDGMFRFWYRFVQPATSSIETGMGSSFYYNAVKPLLNDYMSVIFEKMCQQYTLIEGLSGKLSCFVTQVGKWWGSNPRLKEQTDIDVVGIDTINNKAILGECKFKNSVIDKSIFEDLKSRDNLIDKRYTTCQFILFSKVGFNKYLIENAENENIKLVTLDDLYH